MNAVMTALIVVSGEVFGVGIKRILERPGGQTRARVVRRKALAGYLDRAAEPVGLIVLEADGPSADGREAATMLRGRFRDAYILIAAAPAGRDEMLRYLSWDVQGVIFRTQTVREILKAVQIVLRGGIFLPRALTDSPLRGPLSEGATEAPDRRSIQLRPMSRPAALRTQLSERQRDVLKLLARGLSNKQIARELGLAEATVKVHVNFVFKALNVHNRASAVAAVHSVASAPAPEQFPETESEPTRRSAHPS